MCELVNSRNAFVRGAKIEPFAQSRRHRGELKRLFVSPFVECHRNCAHEEVEHNSKFSGQPTRTNMTSEHDLSLSLSRARTRAGKPDVCLLVSGATE